MSSVVCKACNSNNNPRFENCYRCGHLLTNVSGVIPITLSTVVCSACNSENNPTFQKCYHCGHLLKDGRSVIADVGSAVVCPTCNSKNNPGLQKCHCCGRFLNNISSGVVETAPIREGYDVLKLASFSRVFERGNVKASLWFIPYAVIFMGVDFLLKLMGVGSWLVMLAVALLPGSFFMGYVIKDILPKHTTFKTDTTESMLSVGLKTQIYTILPGLVLQIKMLIIFLLIVLGERYIRTTSSANNPLLIILACCNIAIQTLAGSALFMSVVRFLYGSSKV